jgi:hypothetical protein
MNRRTLADVTYEAGARLNRLKQEFGLVSRAKAEETAARIAEARALLRQLDALSARLDAPALAQAWQALKPRIDRANTSTVCDKSELDVDVGLIPFKVFNLARVGLGLE